MSRTVDYSDTGRTIAKHQNGDIYAVELASVWDNDRCVDTEIIASSGPLHYSDVGLDGWEELGRYPTRVFEHIRDAPLDDLDAEWLNEQESYGALNYPLGYAATTTEALRCK